jgi:hypothetical protein
MFAIVIVLLVMIGSTTIIASLILNGETRPLSDTISGLRGGHATDDKLSSSMEDTSSEYTGSSYAVLAQKVQQRLSGDAEVWARGPVKSTTTGALRSLLGPETIEQLHALCGRCLYRTLTSYVRSHDHGHFTVVLTGDIPAVWLRDSAVQMATYLPRIARRPGVRQTIEGAIRAQAFFILQVCMFTVHAPDSASIVT